MLTPPSLPAEPLVDGNESLAVAAVVAAAGTSHAAQWVAAAVALGIVLFINTVYRSLGPKVQCILLIYIVSLFSTQMAVKAAVSRFPFPMLVTAFHFASTWLATCIFFWSGMGKRGVLPRLSALRKLALSDGLCGWLSYIIQLGPVACALGTSVALNNAALVYIGVSLNGVINIATPLATAVLAAACGSQFAPLAWLGIVVAAFGDIIAAQSGFNAAVPGGKAAAMLGVMCSVGAMLLRSLKSVMQERLMGRSNKVSPAKGCTSAPLQPMQLIAMQAPLLTGVAIVLMVTMEGPHGLAALWAISPAAAAFLLLSCAAATSMNFSQMCAIGLLGAPAAQLAGKLNIFMTTALAAACFGEVLTPGEVGGAALALAGLGLYEKAQKSRCKQQEQMLKAPDEVRALTRVSEASSTSLRQLHGGISSRFIMHVV